MSNSIDFDALGDRMKAYEAQTTSQRLIPLLPIVARVDGKAFHSFTRNMDKPFSKPFTSCMLETTSSLVLETGARLGYTQSDEITLVWLQSSFKEQVWFDGKVFKILSGLAAAATDFFHLHGAKHLPDYAQTSRRFDARVWNVPNEDEAAAAVLWREIDAVKNSISMLASAHFSPSELHGKSSWERKVMLEEKGIVWGNLEDRYKKGAYVLLRREETPFTTEEIEALPPKHHARTNPNLLVERRVLEVDANLPPLSRIQNRADVLFHGAAPVPFLRT